MTLPPKLSDESLRALVEEKLVNDPDFMPQSLAEKLGIPLRRIIESLPDDMRSRAPGEAAVPIWEAMTEWEKVTFMAGTPGAILEIPCRLPKGALGHGMYNLMDTNSALRGHLLMDKVDSVWFVSKRVFGMESHSVQFYDAEGGQCFGVYLGRDEERRIIASVKEGFFTLKALYAGGDCCKKNGVCRCERGHS
ncbi:MAG: heme utilization cystosolic carrier protein HutX [Desulfovibrio sp.]|jgi:putative heme utilization carrier protein HutX|nr:heme utilization cystosolic carrier protein HutX [Desulfovibrio sp.]